jgi:hypothetical protein
VPFVLRLDAERLSAGELSGDIEDVRSGRRHAVHGPQDVVDFCVAGREEVAGPVAAHQEPDPPRAVHPPLGGCAAAEGG